MNKHKHPSNNTFFGHKCGAITEFGTPTQWFDVTSLDWDGVPVIVSYWTPTPEELALLNAGHPVGLSVLGSEMPDAHVFVGTKE